MVDYKRLDEVRKVFFSLYRNNFHKLESYYENFDIEKTFCSVRINGSELTKEEIKNFLLFGYTSKGKNLFDYVKAQNIFDSIKWFNLILSSNQKFDSRILKELNSRILNGIDFRIKKIGEKEIRERIVKGDFIRKKGKLYNENNFTDDNEYKDISSKIDRLLENLYYTKNISIEYCCKFFYEFLKIHPFEMANGRMSRIIINYPLSKGNFPLIIFCLEDKIIYENAFDQASSGNFETLENHILNLLIERYNKMITIMQTRNEV
jgi:Fic family protein